MASIAAHAVGVNTLSFEHSFNNAINASNSLLYHTRHFTRSQHVNQWGICGSGDWGPYQDNGTIDFTLCFENLFILTIPSLFLLVVGVIRTCQTWGLRSVSVRSEINHLFVAKMTVAAIAMIAMLSELCKSIYDVVESSMPLHQVFNATQLFICTILALMWQWWSHARGERSSDLLTMYWFLALVAVIIRIRSLAFPISHGDHSDLFCFISSIVYMVSALVSFLLLQFLEPLSSYYQIGEVFDNNTCPEISSTLASRLTFWWMTPMMRLGYKQALQTDDLFNLNQRDSAAVVAAAFDREWQRQLRKTKGTPSLVGALFRGFSGPMLVGSLFKLFQDLLGFVSPQLLYQIIRYNKSPDAPLWHGLLYSLLMFLCAVVQSMCLHQYFHRAFSTGLRLRTAIIGAVYRKSLVLTSSARQTSTVGEITNLMSVDAQRFMDLMSYINMAWSAPLQMILALYFLFNTMGPSIFAGVGVMILMVPFNATIAIKQRNLQRAQMKLKDQRIKIMNEVLNGIKVIKLYGWDQPFHNKVSDVRVTEMKNLYKYLKWNAALSFAWNCTPFFVSLATFATYTLTGNILTSEKAFTALSLFNLLQFPLTMLPMLVSFMVEASVSVKRVSTFLLHDEIDPLNVTHVDHFMSSEDFDDLPNTLSSDLKPAKNIAILIANGAFQWSKDGAPILTNIFLSVPSRSLVAVVGRVGCGKSSLLATLRGDIERISGSVSIHGSIAYVPQQAWIQNATIRDNIIFGIPFDSSKYSRVVKACALEEDFKQFPAGDITEIGERGINLSGGQKHRISLARAVYQDLDIYLLDDPLSAVDSHVGAHIFEHVIGPNGILKNKTRLLVTHGLQYIRHADLIVVLKDGEIAERGDYNSLMTCDGAFARTISEFQQDSSHSDQDSDEEVLVEGKNTSAQAEKRSKQRSISQAENKSGVIAMPATSSKSSSALLDKSKLIEAETSETGKVSRAVYMSYFTAIGIFTISCVLLENMTAQGLTIGSNVWLSIWSSANSVHASVDIGYYLGVYAVFGASNALMVLIYSFHLAKGSVNASTALHASMLSRVIRSPMSFFDTTPLGRIINRFSKDIYTIDESIPSSFRSFLSTLFRVIGIIIVVTYSTPYFLAAIIPLGIMYLFIQKFYIASSRQLKRLDSVSRSPIYAHFSESLHGVNSIRAYRRSHEFIEENYRRVNNNQEAYYPSISANRWLAVRLEFLGNSIVLFTTLFAVINHDPKNSGIVGLSITYALSVTQTLNWMVRMSSDLETNIVAVERVKEYSELDTEAATVIADRRPVSSWPNKGVIQFDHYTTRYRSELDNVLTDINCTFYEGEKIGIVGRTGAGKSSLTLSLFRLIEAVRGRILIDGIDISSLGLDDVRQRLTIIPQDPVLFSGTIRENLDPFLAYSNIEIWCALDAAHLSTFIRSLPDDIDSTVAESGSNFSVGQAQQICLARALLRKTKILVLDEATAAVDLESDALIQSTIRTEFKDCTIITIAHRLNTIMDSSRIMVLSDGVIAEFDTPERLLANKQSIFSSMVKESKLN